MVGEPKPKVKNFACTSCGSGITVRNPNSLSAGCPTCGAVIDISNEEYNILFSYGRNVSKNQLMEFGTRGKLFGRTWEMIGYMRRSDTASGVWDEYLLFNPYYGYRWLLQDKGHWNFVTPIKYKPEYLSRWGMVTTKSVEMDGLEYRLYNRGKAEVIYVAGEFYWRVEKGQVVDMDDFICPPFMLSSERTAMEVVWAKSEYVDARELGRAFGLEKIPSPIDIAPTQPSPTAKTFKAILPYWMGFAVLLTCVQFFHAGSALNSIPFQHSYPYQANKKVENAITTETFVLSKAMSNVRIDFRADVDNSWLYLSGELVNDKTGETYPFDRTIEYYHGYEDGESWSEGSNGADLLISRVPSGLYYLNLDYESGDFKGLGTHLFDVSVHRDVTMYANYFWGLFFVSIFPFWYWLRTRSFEIARWSNSDFSPYASSSSSSSYSSDDD